MKNIKKHTKKETQAIIENKLEKGKLVLEDRSIRWMCKTIKGTCPVGRRTSAQWVIKGDKSRLFEGWNVMEEGRE